jgi:hypothetical protein
MRDFGGYHFCAFTNPFLINMLHVKEYIRGECDVIEQRNGNRSQQEKEGIIPDQDQGVFQVLRNDWASTQEDLVEE